MNQESQKFGYQEACAAVEVINNRLRPAGLVLSSIRDGLVLGSGLGNFTKDHMDPKSVAIPYNDIFSKIGIDGGDHSQVAGHAQQLVIGPLKGTTDNRLVIAQSGREHPYEGVDTQRSTFWIRVMQVLGVKTLFGSNAVGIVTPQTLKVPSLMLVAGDLDFGWDNPLVGPNDGRFGPRFPHMGDHYPKVSREMIKKVAEREGIPLQEGLHVRLKGPNYESKELIYWLRNVLRGVFTEAQSQPRETDFQGEPVGVVGMSSTFEHMVAQQAAQAGTSPQHHAFESGRAHVCVGTNYAAGLGPEGPVDPPNHEEVGANARLIQDQFGRLVCEVILAWRQPVEELEE